VSSTTPTVKEHALDASRADSGHSAKRATSPWVIAAVVGLAYLLVVIPRLAGGHAYQYVHVGHMFLTKSTASSVIKPSLGYESEVGYDGQFYFFLAADPEHGRYYMESPGFVYSRIVYPMTARALSAGQVAAIPYVMVLLNVAAVVGGTLLLAIWLRRRGLPPAYAYLYGFFPGLIFSVFRDLTEPLAFGLAMAGVLAFDRSSGRRLAASATLFAIAALTRETTLLFPALLTLSLLFGGPTTAPIRDRLRTGWWRAIAFGAAALVPLLAWRWLLAKWLGAGIQTQESPGTGSTAVTPFHAIIDQWPWTRAIDLVFLAVVIPALASLALALAALRRKANVYIWMLIVNIGVFVVLLPGPIAVDYGAAGRAVIGVVLAALLALPQYEQERFGGPSRLIRYSFLLWSLPWYVLVAIVLGGPGPGFLW
jgi:hypothetical protein